MEIMLQLLYKEKSLLEETLNSYECRSNCEIRSIYDKKLEVIEADIARLEIYIDRPGMQTFSELLFVDDIRLRINHIMDREKG